MKNRKRFFCLFVCISLLLSAVFAGAPAVGAVSNPVITVTSVTAMTDDKVVVDIAISGNTGLLAVTVSIAYDNTALEYSKYYRGILKDYLVVDHGTYISFVNCENYDCRTDGNLISIEFKVKDTAAPGFYPITLKNAYPDKYGDSLNRCFACWDYTEIDPTVIPGGVTAVIRGDVNGDGAGDIKDMISLKKHIAGSGKNVNIPAGGDFDHDDFLGAVDLAAMRRFLLGV